MSRDLPNIVVDFDGVLNTYTGWHGDDQLFEPAEGAKEFLQTLSKFYNVCILSTRPAVLLEPWFKEHGLHEYVFKFTDSKPPAVAYIDDRAIEFKGDFGAVIDRLKAGFKPHWRK